MGCRCATEGQEYRRQEHNCAHSNLDGREYHAVASRFAFDSPDCCAVLTRPPAGSSASLAQLCALCSFASLRFLPLPSARPTSSTTIYGIFPAFSAPPRLRGSKSALPSFSSPPPWRLGVLGGSIRDHLPPGCQGRRKNIFSYVQNKKSSQNV